MRLDEDGKPGADLPADVVIARLRELFGDHPELDLPMVDGDIVELELVGERAISDWSVYVGANGIQRIVVEINPEAWDAPAQEFRREATPVIDVLVQLARETGARLLDAADPDYRNLTVEEALEMVAPAALPDA